DGGEGWQIPLALRQGIVAGHRDLVRDADAGGMQYGEEVARLRIVPAGDGGGRAGSLEVGAGGGGSALPAGGRPTREHPGAEVVALSAGFAQGALVALPAE